MEQENLTGYTASAEQCLYRDPGAQHHALSCGAAHMIQATIAFSAAVVMWRWTRRQADRPRNPFALGVSTDADAAMAARRGHSLLIVWNCAASFTCKLWMSTDVGSMKCFRGVANHAWLSPSRCESLQFPNPGLPIPKRCACGPWICCHDTSLLTSQAMQCRWP
jgi:hypothetical protein